MNMWTSEEKKQWNMATQVPRNKLSSEGLEAL